MKNFLYLCVFICSLSSQALDKTSYKKEDLDAIIEKSKSYNPEQKTGQTIMMPPQKVLVQSKIAAFPKKCEAHTYVERVLMASGIRIPPNVKMNYCMQVYSDKGVKVNFFVQESLVKYIYAEYKVNDPITIRGAWILVNGSDKKPYFIVNAIGD